MNLPRFFLLTTDVQDGVDRGRDFIANTIAGLRGLGPPQPPPKEVQVWLLRTDGAQLLPVWRESDQTCATRLLRPDGSLRLERWPRLEDEIKYEIPAAEGEKAIAVAIRVDDEYYIERLQLPAPSATTQQ